MRWKRSFTVYGCHCEGEVCNVITGGVETVPGATMFDKMKYFRENCDDTRKLILFEPRGSVNHNANIIFPSEIPEAAAGFIILETTEYPVMSGGNVMAVASVLLKTGVIPVEEPVTRFKLESPAGLIDVECECRENRVYSVRFVNQPAFVYYLDASVDVPDIGRITVDVAYGGMTYVIVKADDIGVRLRPEDGRLLCDLGERIKTAAAEQLETIHPLNPEIAGITQTLFAGSIAKTERGLESTNAVVVRPGRLDRCPCGTGTSARLAVLHSRGLIGVGESFIHKSVIGTEFVSDIVETLKVGPYDAVVPAMSGRCWISFHSEYGLEEDDPFPAGYKIGDLWGNIASL